MPRPRKVLFLLKKNSEYGYKIGVRSGLYNSVNMLIKELQEEYCLDLQLSICIDGNSLDKYLHEFRPHIAIIEAIWVTPAKIRELVKKYNKTTFIIRVHSEIPFLANEGIAIEWIKAYDEIPRTTIAFNSLETKRNFDSVLKYDTLYLPNLYDSNLIKNIECRKDDSLEERNYIDIASFGAIRPMKNQLLQAFAAIKFANLKNKILRFHINGTRLEQRGDNVLKNLRALFTDSRHELVEHPWLEREDFLEVVSFIDIGLQLSYSETFNIVAADFVSQGIPIIVSDAIRWMPDRLTVKVMEMDEILMKLNFAYNSRRTACRLQAEALALYNHKAKKEWSYI